MGGMGVNGWNATGELGSTRGEEAVAAAAAAADSEASSDPSPLESKASSVTWLERRGLKVLGVVAAENITWAVVAPRRV